jgi:hypothetical protein
LAAASLVSSIMGWCKAWPRLLNAKKHHGVTPSGHCTACQLNHFQSTLKLHALLWLCAHAISTNCAYYFKKGPFIGSRLQRHCHCSYTLCGRQDILGASGARAQEGDTCWFQLWARHLAPPSPTSAHSGQEGGGGCNRRAFMCTCRITSERALTSTSSFSQLCIFS